MPERWVELDHYTSARTGRHTVVAVLHLDGDGFGCGHNHRSADAAERCASEQWPDVEIREVGRV
ncbi:hypothetical protein [Microbacterium sp.]|uniref:hypothetical protein n=1 Tax=Microbacterium sp. TaxID=51671 RepID=UPI003A909C31